MVNEELKRPLGAEHCCHQRRLIQCLTTIDSILLCTTIVLSIYNTKYFKIIIYSSRTTRKPCDNWQHVRTIHHHLHRRFFYLSTPRTHAPPSKSIDACIIFYLRPSSQKDETETRRDSLDETIKIIKSYLLFFIQFIISHTPSTTLFCTNPIPSRSY